MSDITQTFNDKWYHHGQLVALKRNILGYEAGSIGRIKIIETKTTGGYIGVNFWGDAVDDVNICDFVENDPPLLTEYCEPIAEDDPRVLAYLGLDAPVALTEQDDARLMIELFDLFFKGVEAYAQILQHYGEKFLSVTQHALLSENLKRAHAIGERDKELFQKACLYFLDEGASLDGFWEFYNGLGIVATDGNPFYRLGVLLGKIPRGQ